MTSDGLEVKLRAGLRQSRVQRFEFVVVLLSESSDVESTVDKEGNTSRVEIWVADILDASPAAIVSSIYIAYYIAA